MNRNWAIINLIQLEHTFWSLSVLKELPQVSLTSMTLSPMDREIITNDISVVILFDSNLSFAFEANFCYFFLKKIFCLLNFPSWKFAYRLARYPKRETVINNYLLFWNKNLRILENSLSKTVKKENHIILIKNEQELSYYQFDSAWTHFLVIVCSQGVATSITYLNDIITNG